jgi:drug/metabolite transporter (DMT)-like permease
MARSLISVVAPVSAVVGAAVPVLYALARGERPGAAASAGIVIALVAVVIVSIAPDDPHQAHLPVTPVVIGLSVVAGGFFGLFVITLSNVSDAAGMWPVALARTAGTLTLLAAALGATRGVSVPSGLGRLIPSVAALEVIAAVPLLLALQRGPVTTASVMASLYPVPTVLLAALLLRERISRLQQLGVSCALVAVVLVSTS